jgi:hypothetical protein
LHRRFCATKKKGPASDTTKKPRIIDQNLLASNVLICLIQQPPHRSRQPILKQVAAENTVYIFILIRNIGTAVTPKHNEHIFTISKETPYASLTSIAHGVKVILTAAPASAQSK